MSTIVAIVFTHNGRTDYEHLHVQGLDDPVLMQRIHVLTDSGREVECIDPLPSSANVGEIGHIGRHIQ